MRFLQNPSASLRPARVLLVAAALLACAHVAARAATAPRPATGPYRIAGRVVNGVTGEPVRRATVAALAEEDREIVRSVQSDAEGRFSIEQMPAGKYPLTASKRGFRAAFYDEHDEFNSAIVTGEGQETVNLEFRLVPGAVLHGVVTADGGDPAENASVILFKREGDPAQSQGRSEIKEVDGGTTDDTGAYEFTNLAAGEYFVAVATSPWYAMHPRGGTRRNAANESSPLDVAYPVTFFDSTNDEASATPVVLSAGSREQADITLHAVPALHLQVAAPFKANGAAMARPELRQMIFGIQISAESAGFNDAMQSGSAEFNGVAPGRYELVQGDPARISELDATTSQSVDPNTGTPAVSVSGLLRSSSGADLPENVTVLLEPVGRTRATIPTNAHKGKFKFDAVPAGTWSVWASSQGSNLPVVSVTTGESAVAGNQLTVRDRSLSVVANVSQSLSRVEGFTRKDGKGLAGAMIVLVPRQPSAYRALVRRDQSDSDGSFSLRDVPAGPYTVIAIEDGWKLDWTRRENLVRFLAGGVAVTVGDRPEAVVSLSQPVAVQAR
jgi:5-hydroxyisourate hydrolase-like protein (transthyretin family)